METIGLIAGNGSFPVLFARAARGARRRLVAVAHEGETSPELAEVVDHLTWIRVGQVGAMIDALLEAGVERAVMAGGIHKAGLLERFEPDERGKRVLSRLETWSDDAVLRALAGELESSGIQVVSSTLFLEHLLATPGVMSRRQPDDEQWRDIRYGAQVARAVGRWDVGQTVVVKSGIVLAVEAIEGTDEALRRGGALGRGGAVAVKVSKPGQDLRFDVPAVGPHTVDTCVEAGVEVLALEAGRTLLLERRRFLEQADRAGLCVVGIDGDGE